MQKLMVMVPSLQMSLRPLAQQAAEDCEVTVLAAAQDPEQQ